MKGCLKLAAEGIEFLSVFRCQKLFEQALNLIIHGERALV